MTDRRPRRLERFFMMLYPALLGPAQLLLFGLFVTYTHNPGEFLAPFWTLAAPWLWLLGAVTLILAAIGTRLPAAAAQRYAAALFAIGLLLWVQGNLLVADYGPLYGERLDFTPHEWRAPWEIALWVLVPLVCVWFARPVSAAAPLASQVLLGLQAVVLVVSGAASRPAEHETAAWSSPDDRVYRLSTERNVIHVVLDGFLSEVFGEIADHDRDVFDRDLSGFVFFADHLGAFPTTRASMPAMLSGVRYRNDRPLGEFLKASQTPSIFTMLHGAGYRITGVTFHRAELPPPGVLRDRVTRYDIPTPYGTEGEYVRFAAAQLIDLTLFRHAPHGVKQRVYNDDAWLVQALAGGALSRSQAVRHARPSNHLIFLEDLTSRLRVEDDAPVYFFLHLAVPHPPILLDGECGFLGPQRLTRESYRGQARCALTVVRRFLARLRELGAYENSLIVLTSDHGWYLPRPDHPFGGRRSPAGPMDRVVLSAMPLLAVKPIGGAGPLRTSAAPTAITDLPATILALAGLDRGSLPGRPALEIDPEAPRRRTYGYHSWEDADWQRSHLELLHLFTVDGRVLDPAAWRFDRAIFDPGSPLEPQLARKRTGLSSRERDGGVAFRQGDPYVVVYAPPDARALAVRFARSPRATRTQRLTVRVDGRAAAGREVADDAWHDLRLPLAPRAGGAAFTIELVTEPPAYDEDGRHLGFRYQTIEGVR